MASPAPAENPPAAGSVDGSEGSDARATDVLSYYRELRRAQFALCPAGWTPWSRRIYESILLGCIPVFIPGDFVPPFAHDLDWSRFSITIDASQIPFIDEILRAFSDTQVEAMLNEVEQVRHRFRYHSSPQEGDAGSGVLAELERVWHRIQSKS